MHVLEKAPIFIRLMYEPGLSEHQSKNEQMICFLGPLSINVFWVNGSLLQVKTQGLNTEFWLTRQEQRRKMERYSGTHEWQQVEKACRGFSKGCRNFPKRLFSTQYCNGRQIFKGGQGTAECVTNVSPYTVQRNRIRLSVLEPVSMLSQQNHSGRQTSFDWYALNICYRRTHSAGWAARGTLSFLPALPNLQQHIPGICSLCASV